MTDIRKTVHKEGPRKVFFTECGGGVEDKGYYYNIIDYAGDMSKFVNITRHKTLAQAKREAKRCALDRKWTAPGTSAYYVGIPPRIIRTLKFTECHRTEVRGPQPKGQLTKFTKYDNEVEKKRKKFWDNFHKQIKWGAMPNEGKPHPPLK